MGFVVVEVGVLVGVVLLVVIVSDDVGVGDGVVGGRVDSVGVELTGGGFVMENTVSDTSSKTNPVPSSAFTLIKYELPLERMVVSQLSVVTDKSDCKRFQFTPLSAEYET